jgi:hypothetical protein
MKIVIGRDSRGGKTGHCRPQPTFYTKSRHNHFIPEDFRLRLANLRFRLTFKLRRVDAQSFQGSAGGCQYVALLAISRPARAGTKILYLAHSRHDCAGRIHALSFNLLTLSKLLTATRGDPFHLHTTQISCISACSPQKVLPTDSPPSIGMVLCRLLGGHRSSLGADEHGKAARIQ